MDTPPAEDEQVVSFLREHQPDTFAQRDLAEALNLTKSAVQSALTRLERAGRVSRPGGKRGGYTVAPDVSPEAYD